MIRTSGYVICEYGCNKNTWKYLIMELLKSTWKN